MDTRDAGRMGGQAKVPKGFAMMSPEERSANAKKGNAKRWAKKKVGRPKKKAGGKK